MSELSSAQLTGKPTPRPPLLAEVMDPSEFAHVLKATIADRAAVIVGRRSQGEVRAELVWEGPRDAARQVVADQVINLIRIAQSLPDPLAIVGPTSVMVRLRQLGFADPHVVLGVRNGRHYLTECLDLAEEWRNRTATVSPASRLMVATDASVGLGRGSAGLACVDEHGRQFTQRLRSRNVLYCELRAIKLALDHFAGPLRILTDSQASVGLITNAAHRAQPRTQAVVDQIRALVAERDVSVEWMRGHDGHPLNEAADRLAMAARRARELSMPACVARQIKQQIVQDLVKGAA